MRILIIASESPPVASGVAHSVDRLVPRAAPARARGRHASRAPTPPTSSPGRCACPGWAAGCLRLAPEIAGLYDLVNVHGPVPTISDFSLGLLRAIRRQGRPRVLYTHHSTLEFDEGLLAGLGSAYTAPPIACWPASRITSSSPARRTPTCSATTTIARSRWCRGASTSSRFQPAAPTGYDGTRPLRVLFVGQLRPYKGAAVAIDAVAHQRRLALTLVGRGPGEGALLRRVAEQRRRQRPDDRISRRGGAGRRLSGARRLRPSLHEPPGGVRAHAARGHGRGLRSGRLRPSGRA